MRITIKRANQGDIQVVADLEQTVAEFKQLISASVSLPTNHIRLVCEGRVWEDGVLLSHYDVSEEKPVHCLRYSPPAQTSATPAIPSPAVGETDWLQHMMNSPTMQQMMSNPEIMRSLLRMNPEMNELLERQPEMARLLEDPEILQQSLNAMRNPAMMREMMRQADRSMSNLETVPGGMDALRRMHTEFSDPLYEAMHGSRGDGLAAPQQYEQQTDGPMNAAPVPNPWAATGTSTASAAVPAPAAGGDMSALQGMFANRGQRANTTSTPGFAPNPFGAAPPWGSPPWTTGAQQATNGWSHQPFSSFAVPNYFAPQFRAPVPQEPLDDECRLKIKFNTQTHLVVCKKVGTVAELKSKLEPLVQIRRHHIRLVQAGRVWEDAATVESYAPGHDSDVFTLKYVPPGQVDLGPPMPANSIGRPGSAMPLNPFMPAPETRFTTQLNTLADMGFTDRQICIQTLLSVDGDVTRALDILLGGGS